MGKGAKTPQARRRTRDVVLELAALDHERAAENAGVIAEPLPRQICKEDTRAPDYDGTATKPARYRWRFPH